MMRLDAEHTEDMIKPDEDKLLYAFEEFIALRGRFLAAGRGHGHHAAQEREDEKQLWPRESAFHAFHAFHQGGGTCET